MRRSGILLGLLLVTAGTAIALWQHVVNAAYAKLGEQVVIDPASNGINSSTDDQSGGSIDWDYLVKQNQDAAAWVVIDGTSISLPVVEARPDDRDHYLTHDFWNRPALEGTPFLDHRCTASDRHRLVYGHHLTTGGQFSELQKAFEQETFDQLGLCHWYTSTNGEKVMHPLFALCVDMHYGQIQRFDFRETEELHRWLSELEPLASAQSTDASALVHEAISVVTLVTCSSDLAHQPWRTLVVFVEIPVRSPESTNVNGGIG